jgi:hypothetical protein
VFARPSADRDLHLGRHPEPLRHDRVIARAERRQDLRALAEPAVERGPPRAVVVEARLSLLEVVALRGEQDGLVRAQRRPARGEDPQDSAPGLDLAVLRPQAALSRRSSSRCSAANTRARRLVLPIERCFLSPNGPNRCSPGEIEARSLVGALAVEPLPHFYREAGRFE